MKETKLDVLVSKNRYTGVLTSTTCEFTHYETFGIVYEMNHFIGDMEAFLVTSKGYVRSSSENTKVLHRIVLPE